MEKEKTKLNELKASIMKCNQKFHIGLRKVHNVKITQNKNAIFYGLNNWINQLFFIQ